MFTEQHRIGNRLIEKKNENKKDNIYNEKRKETTFEHLLFIVRFFSKTKIGGFHSESEQDNQKCNPCVQFRYYTIICCIGKFIRIQWNEKVIK